MVLATVDIDEIMPFIKECGAHAWAKLRRLIGRDNAFMLAHKKRNEILIELRTEYGYTLEKIASIFDISRERVRQLTPAGLWRKQSNHVDWSDIINRVIESALGQKDAWSQKGRIKRSWIIDRFGKDVAFHVGDAHRAMNKLDMVLHFKLGLKNKASRLAWLSEQYFKRNKGYAEIALDLSRLGIKITTMTIYRCAKAMGFGGYQPGKRHDRPF